MKPLLAAGLMLLAAVTLLSVYTYIADDDASNTYPAYKQCGFVGGLPDDPDYGYPNALVISDRDMAPDAHLTDTDIKNAIEKICQVDGGYLIIDATREVWVLSGINTDISIDAPCLIDARWAVFVNVKKDRQ